MDDGLETNRLEQGISSKSNYEKLKEFFLEKIKILENKGISFNDFGEAKNG